jgi:hypothetical protein
VIDPNRIAKNTQAPSPIIEKLIVDGELIKIKILIKLLQKGGMASPTYKAPGRAAEGSTLTSG